jgi:hypothetical protein
MGASLELFLLVSWRKEKQAQTGRGCPEKCLFFSIKLYPAYAGPFSKENDKLFANLF